MAVTIAAATLQHAPELYAVEVACHRHAMSRNQFHSCLHGRYHALLARDGAAVVGFAIGETVIDEGTLIDIAVLPSCQRRGIARLLLQSMLEQWRANGVTSVFLEVRASNHAARRLYDQQGFNEISVRRGYYPAAEGREDAIVMALQLDWPIPSSS